MVSSLYSQGSPFDHTTDTTCQKGWLSWHFSNRRLGQVWISGSRCEKWVSVTKWTLHHRTLSLAVHGSIIDFFIPDFCLSLFLAKCRRQINNNSFNALPPPHRLVNYDEDSKESKLAVATYNSKSEKAWDQNSELMFDQNVSWDDVKWLKSTICQDLPLVVKGIMTAEDAVLAIEAGGVDGVMVSNHGGRQLDGCLAAIDALPEVVAAVNGRVPVFMDGGIRRGTDVLKALALGASAVGIGKPVFFALAVGGQDAVQDMLRLLQKELQAAMALCGCETINDITPNLITRHPTGSPPARYIRSAL
jgi:isopentenyl diphosphate isomerase/L-lactate dehydrogenase-like FMN-dependent dehydrogenase